MVAVKLVCFLGIPLVTPFVSLLKPHQQAGDWPNGVAWLVTLLVALVGVFNAGLAFTSNAYRSWQDKQPVTKLEPSAPAQSKGVTQ